MTRESIPTNAARAFTLIELLIVVAIIAILAAIAVPNFLEAQVRSKVSRAKSDMRSLATALEAYRVDNRRYPAGFSATGDPTFRTINPRIRRLVPLTTPISYISSIPIDVFSREESSNPAIPNSAVRVFLYADRDTYEQFVPSPYGPVGSSANIYRILWGVQFTSAQWVLRSRGPVGEEGGLGNSIDIRSAYDPTNGTVSLGNILFLGPAIGPI
jgi:type II secretion system protein G